MSPDVDDVLLKVRWRVGRRVGRTLYAQISPSPDDADILIGVLDTTELAKEAAAAHNTMLGYA